MKSFKIISLHFVLCLIFSLNINAQQSIFTRVYYDPNGSMQAYGVARSSDGGFCIAGNHGDGACLFKVDSAGDLVWSKVFFGGWGDAFNSVITIDDSCFVAAGKMLNPISTNQEFSCIKVNASGDTLWTKTISIGDHSEAYSVQQTYDSGFIVTGYVGYNGGGSPNKILVVKLNSVGDLEWNYTLLGSNSSNTGYSVKQTPDSGYIITGHTQAYPPLVESSYLAKLSSTGTLLWSKKYNLNTPVICTGYDLLVTTNGFLSYFVAGHHLVLMKTDFSGNIIWNKSYNSFDPVGSPSDAGAVMHQNADGTFVLINGNNWGQSSISKFDSSGTLIWLQNLYFIVIDFTGSYDSGYFIVGNGPLFGVRLSTPTNPQIGLIKTDSLGNSDDCTYPYNAGLVVDTITIDSTLFTSTLGGTINSLHPVITTPLMQFDFGCVAFVGGIEENEKDNTITVFPNPTKDKLNISIGQEINNGQLSIYNIWGQEIFTKKIEHAIDGNILIDGKIPPGIYTLMIKSSDKVYATKFVAE